MSARSRAPEYDLIRVLCMCTVALFHWGTTCTEQGLAGASDAFVAYPNGTWGEMASLVFIMLSGAVLALNYPAGRISLPAFYKKRWLSIYPLYYLAYGLAACWLLVFWPGYFGNASPFKFFLSFLGMDGYFAYRWAGSYILGEWFLGAIVLLYLLYPLLAWAMEHRAARAVVTVVLPIAFVLVVRHGWFGVYYAIYSLHNLFTCALCFWLGMLYQKYRSVYPRLFRAAAALCLPVLAVTFFLPLPMNHFYWMMLDAACAFLALAELSPLLLQWKPLTAACTGLGRYAYAMLLVHHVLFQQVFVRRFGAFAATLPGCLLGLAGALAGAFLLQTFYDFLRGFARKKTKSRV